MAEVIGWGGNTHAELGTGFAGAVQITPVIASMAPPNIIEVGASYHFSALRDTAGDLYMFGGNGQGEQGNGTNKDDSQPFKVPLPPVAQVALGGAHAHARLVDGRIASWGENAGGQIGNGSKGEHSGGLGQTTPVILSPFGPVATQVAAGGSSVAALLDDGTVWAWGGNPSGQLGTGDLKERLVPTKMPFPGPATKVAVGGATAHGGLIVALLEDGTVWGCGGSAHGQLGVTTGDQLHPVKLPVEEAVDVAAAATHVLVVTANEGLRPFGAPGPWLPPAGLQGVTDMAVNFQNTLLIISGQVYSAGAFLGREDAEPLEVVPNLSGATDIAVGEFHALTIASTTLARVTMRVTAIPGGADVSWSAPSGTENWKVQWRPVTKPKKSSWSKPVVVSVADRECVLAMPSGKPCEVQVTNHTFGHHIVGVTPL